MRITGLPVQIIRLFGRDHASRSVLTEVVLKRMAWKYTVLQEKLSSIQTKLEVRMENKRYYVTPIKCCFYTRLINYVFVRLKFDNFRFQI